MRRRTSLGELGFSALGCDVEPFAPRVRLRDPDLLPGAAPCECASGIRVTVGGEVVEGVRSVSWGTG